MIIEKYAGGVRALTTDQLRLVTSRLMSLHPEHTTPFTPERGEDLLAFCRTNRISQAELIMSISRTNDLVGVGALEALLCRPIERITPATLRRTREDNNQQTPPTSSSTASTQPTTKSSSSDPRIIHLLVDKNPKREGTSAHVRFARYTEGMTVEDFLAAGGTSGDIKWDIAKKFITLQPPA